MQFPRVFLFVCLFLAFFGGSVVFSASFEEVTGLIDPLTNEAYILVDSLHTASATDIFLRKDAYQAFLAMHQQAKKDGVDLLITSGRRSFSEQKNLFATYGVKRALPPGTSSHHFGQAIDFANKADGGGAYIRLRDYAHKFGFCQTYDGHSSAQEAESRHYEYHPEQFRESVMMFRDEIYLYILRQDALAGDMMTKKELFERYVYPISHSCIDAYPSVFKDPLTGIKFDRKLDSATPHHLVYALSRYKFPASPELLSLLPPEIRFVKTDDDKLHFAPLQAYPKLVQDLFPDYEQWFRTGVERFVLLRSYAYITMSSQTKVAFVQKK